MTPLCESVSPETHQPCDLEAGHSGCHEHLEWEGSHVSMRAAWANWAPEGLYTR